MNLRSRAFSIFLAASALTNDNECGRFATAFTPALPRQSNQLMNLKKSRPEASTVVSPSA